MCPHIGDNDKAPMKKAQRAPKGRPPYGHKYEAGAWISIVTGQPLDPSTHAYKMKLKKRACMKQGYWERGGRERRLSRYARKCPRSQSQLTIDTFTTMGDMILHLPSLEADIPHMPFNR